MTSHWRRRGRLAAAGFAAAALVTISACGSSGTPSAAASPAATPDLAKLATCLDSHGVQVATPLTRKGVRSALRSVAKSTRHSAVAACEQYAGGLTFGGGGGDGGKASKDG